MTMKIAFHGGKCCGIKTIHGMGTDPNATQSALRKPRRTEKQDNADQYGPDIRSSTNFYRYSAPKETSLQRLDRYIAFLKEVRPQGIIEIVLAKTSYDFSSQLTHWNAPLLERGFKEVNRCKNSNSGNTVVVYHLNCGEGA